MTVQTAGPGVTVLDLHFQGMPQAIASFLIADGDEAALVETGPSTTIPSLLDGLAVANTDPSRVTKLLLTHIHLDHAGAAGSLTRLLPDLRVYVHEVGAPHLLDPSRLVASAARIYGDDMGRLWGEVLPVPEERLVVLTDGDEVEVPGRRLVAVYTPGHASHHVTYWDAGARIAFTGDVAGIRVPGAASPIPPTPPPDLDLQLWADSIDQLLELDPTTLYLTHFGPVSEPDEHLRTLRFRLHQWSRLLLDAIHAGQSEAELIDLLQEETARAVLGESDDEVLRDQLQLVSGNAMNVAGFLRYFRERGVTPS